MGASDESAAALRSASEALRPEALYSAAEGVTVAIGFIQASGQKYVSKYIDELTAAADRLSVAAQVTQQMKENLANDAAREAGDG